MDNNLLQLLQSMAASQQTKASEAQKELNFAQRLRDERLGQVQQFQQSQAPVFTGQETVPSNPIERFDRSMAFLEAGRGVLDPVNDRIKMAQDSLNSADAQNMNILQLILQQAERDRQFELDRTKSGIIIDPETGKLKVGNTAAKLDDLLATRKSMADQGLSTAQIDEQLKQYGVVPSKEISPEASSAITLIDEVFQRGAGAVSGVDSFRGQIPFTKARGTRKKVDQLKAQLSLEAREKLKGSGAISDKESQMLQDSVTSLSYDMSDKDFQAELLKIRGILSGKVIMQDPSGARFEIDPEEMNEAEQNGWKVVG